MGEYERVEEGDCETLDTLANLFYVLGPTFALAQSTSTLHSSPVQTQ